MKRYKLVAPAVLAREIDANSPEYADELSRTLTVHDCEQVEWIDTTLLVKQGREFAPVPAYTTADLWTQASQSLPRRR